MKKIVAAIFGLIGLFSVSCRVCTYTQSENKTCMQFVEHLTVVDKILNDTILYGWYARRMRPEDDINAYHLLYDTGTWYRPYYLNYYRFDSADPIHKEDVVDTTLLCRCWGIEKDSFQPHINKVCKYLREITNGYNIYEMQFFKFGFYVFESHDGWKIIYQRDTVLKDAKQQEFKSKVFPSYSQIGNTRFWVLTDEEK